MYTQGTKQVGMMYHDFLRGTPPLGGGGERTPLPLKIKISNKSVDYFLSALPKFQVIISKKCKSLAIFTKMKFLKNLLKKLKIVEKKFVFAILLFKICLNNNSIHI